ncbi:HAD family hydrolase [bacterium]|nr:HAD family hydrolase [bacterium]
MTSKDHSNITAAFFDFDETLLAIDSAGIGFKVLREQGYLSRAFILKMIIVMLLKKAGFINEKIMANAMLSFYRGRDLQPFIDSAEDFYLEYLRPNLAPEVIKKLRWHQKQGHQTVLVTGSIDYYLQPVKQDLGIDHLLCTHLEMGPDGLLTGRPNGPVCVGDTKLILAQELAAEQGLDLTISFAYGNSELDIPLMENVGYPVVVNPTAGLSRYAKKQKWSIL